MKPLLALLLAALSTMSQARHPGASEPPIPPDGSRCQANSAPTPAQARDEALRDEVRAGTAVPDHQVQFDGFDFDVYVDRSFSPPVVVVAQPLESINRIFEIGSIRKQKYLMRKFTVMKRNYERSMRGEPLQAVPTDDQPASADDEGEPEAVNDIYECIQYYPQGDTGYTYLLGGGNVSLNQVYIDFYGRPGWSSFRGDVEPITAERDRPCQRTVGTWGKPGQDQGGHGIGARLGGWGGRANLTPQDKVLNEGKEWKSLDGAADFCATATYLTNHRVDIAYDGGVLRPRSYTVSTYAYTPTCPQKLVVDVTTTVGNYLPALTDNTNMTLHSNAVKRACTI